jgi:DNA repair protein RadC
MQTKLNQILAEVSFLRVKEATGEPFRFSGDIFESMRAEALIDRECAWVLHLNSANKVIEKELVSMGTISQALVQPRETFRKAIMNGSAAIIIVHNHPSGVVKASDSDIMCCLNLKKAGKILNIPILDFIIIGREKYLSFAEESIGGFN